MRRRGRAGGTATSMPTGSPCSPHGAPHGRPIIHVRHDSVQPGSTLAPGTPGNAFRPGFEPLDGEPLVTKSVNAAFIGTDLAFRLKRLGAKHVVTFGISTDMCVSTTVRTGANLGWDMILVPDACDCFDLPDGQGGIDRRRRRPARPCRHPRLRILPDRLRPPS